MKTHSSKRSLLAVSLALWVMPATADTGRLGFKGVELGSGLAQIASNPKFECHVVSTPIADKICSLRARESETIAGAPVDSLFYFYDRNSLTGIVGNLPETRFQAVLAALSEKYGTPGQTLENVKNLKGVVYENRVYRWSRSEDAILAVRFAGRLDKSTIRITDEAAAKRVKQHRALLAKDPHQDL